MRIVFEMDAFQRSLNTLFDLLVKEFRACQALSGLIRDEHFALVCSQVAELLEISGRKEDLLDRLNELGSARQETLGVLVDLLGIEYQGGRPFTLNQIKASIDPETSDRLIRLQVGIQVIMEQVRTWTCVNQALAAVVLTQVSASQGEFFRRQQLGAYQALLQVSNLVLASS